MKQAKKNHYQSSLKLLWLYAKSYYSLIIGFVIALVLSSVSVLSLGKALTFLIDSGLIHNGSLNSSLILLLAIVIILSLATSLRFYFVTLLSEKIILNIRKDVFNNLIHQTQIFYSNNKIGHLLSSVTNDLVLIQNFIATNLSILLRNIIILIGAIIILFTTNIYLFFYIIFLIPIIVIPLMIFVKKLKKQSRETQDVIADLTSHMHEHLSAIKTIQAFSCENYSKKIFNEQQKSVLTFSQKRIATRSFLTLIIIFAVLATILILIKKAGILMLSGQLTAGELSSFIFFSILIAGAFGAITEVIGNLFKSLGAFERINYILNQQPSASSQSLQNEVIAPIFPLVMKNVSFSYPDKENAITLNNINLTIKQNQIIAIVGPSGSGKSTIFNLFLKFYNVNKGSITFNELGYDHISNQTVRSHFSLVPQDPFIFSGSIAENISLDDNYDEQRIIEALKTAQIYEFVRTLPHTILTELGENGAKISAGQRQRIAIARAVYHKSSVILLDEATSNIDKLNEQSFVDCVNNLKQHHTIIIIAHRRETIQNADFIYVLNNGEIVEEGTEEELYNKKGLYKTLLGMQSD
ncbi:MAG: ATP-binding cassette domain-containing protein [Rickettsiales bacterium]|jgi:ATP-binding cassette, subfamily B, bacterial|nr:ATP-binding cassette domain-containing protein [Rickettsiales bacterium]